MGMLLSRLLDNRNVPETLVSGITSDSRSVRPGDLFLAYRGRQFDGHDFVGEAIARGAAAVVAENSKPMELQVPWVQLKNVAHRTGELAAKFYGYPTRKMDLVGVTGTNGKSSVAFGTACLVEATACIGTLGWGVPPSLCSSSLTTFEPAFMHQCAAKLAKNEVKRAVVEVSSHALDQGRVDDIPFSCAVFTNLTRDHLDYHGNMEHYRNAKFRLFKRPELQRAIVNLDDELGKRIACYLSHHAVECHTYGSSSNADLQWRDVHFNSKGLQGRWFGQWGEAEFQIPFWGEMYLANAAAMLLSAVYYGVEFKEAVERMRTLRQVPGRMEVISHSGTSTAVLDYAHTPDALRNALLALRQHTQGRLVCVFGCGGNRDRGKRSEMGRIAQEIADYVVVTSDNPRDEDPQQIIDQICEGMPSNSIHSAILNRTEAIFHAFAESGPSDTILVAGKGHERYQEVLGIRHPYSDRAVIQKILEDSC